MVGLGTAIGIGLSAVLPRLLPALVVAVVVAVVVGFVAWGWPEALGGAVGALCGVIGGLPFVLGTLRRGGTPAGTATLLGAVALVGAALAFIPIVGYLEAVAVLVLGARLRRRAPETHAGLRTLARD
jgi:hypothetical protein